MKKVIYYIVLSMVISIVMPACKKGEDDPFISLRSRKSRVAGEWKVESKEDLKNIMVSSPSQNIDAVEKTSISGSSYSNVYTDAVGSNTKTGTVNTYNMNFDKDGNFSSVFELQKVNVLGTPPFETRETTVTRIENSGTWNFLSNVGDAKNKEYLSLSTNKSTTTETITTVDPSFPTQVSTSTTTESFANNESVEVWKLIELRNSTLVAEMELNYAEVISATAINPASERKVSGSSKITLKQ
jgi:hypothetical protein